MWRYSSNAVAGTLEIGVFMGCGGSAGKEPICQRRRRKRRGFNPSVRKIPWRRKWQPTPVFLPGKVHGQGSLGRLRVHRVAESDTSELTHTLWTLGRVQACLQVARQIHYKYIWFKRPTGTAVNQVRNRVCEQHFLKLELQYRLSPLYFFTLFFSCFFHFLKKGTALYTISTTHTFISSSIRSPSLPWPYL